MNTNKILLILFFTLFVIFPIKSVNANNSKRINASCTLEYSSGSIDYNTNTCSEEILKNKLKTECGKGTLIETNLSFTCKGAGGTQIGSSLREACERTSIRREGDLITAGINAECNVVAENIGDSFCEEEDVIKIFTFLGFILFFGKLLVPFILIIMGTFDYFKAVTNEKSEVSLAKQTQVLIRRIITGIIIFFVPTIIKLGLNFVNSWSDVEPEYEKCAKCALDPISCNE